MVGPIKQLFLKVGFDSLPIPSKVPDIIVVGMFFLSSSNISIKMPVLWPHQRQLVQSVALGGVMGKRKFPWLLVEDDVLYSLIRRCLESFNRRRKNGR